MKGPSPKKTQLKKNQYKMVKLQDQWASTSKKNIQMVGSIVVLSLTNKEMGKALFTTKMVGTMLVSGKTTL